MLATNRRPLKHGLHGAITVAIVTSMYLFCSGCGPDLILGGAIAMSILSAHYQYGSLGNKPRATVRTVSGRTHVYESKRKYTAVKEIETLPKKRVGSQGFKQQSVCGEILNKGVKAYEQLKWEESTLLLRRAITANCLSRSEASQAYILLGAIAYQRGDTNDARDWFERAAEADSTVMPSAELFPPPMIEFYKSVKKR